MYGCSVNYKFAHTNYYTSSFTILVFLTRHGRRWHGFQSESETGTSVKLIYRVAAYIYTTSTSNYIKSMLHVLALL